MNRRFVLALALAMLVAPLLFVSVPSAAQTEPRADAAVQVTQTPLDARSHAAPLIAVHPENDQTIAIAEADAFSGECSLHVSTDAGLSWTATPIPQDPQWPSCVYANFGPIADVAFGADGTLYYAFSGQDPKTYQSRMFLARSADLGRSFEVAQVPWVEPDLADGQFGADALPSVVVHPSDPKRVYVSWMSNNGTWNLSGEVLEGQEYFWDIVSRPYVAASDDGGKTFSGPIDMAGDLEGWMSEPYLAVGDDGSVYGFFGQNVKARKDAAEGTKAPPAHLHLAVSRDGAKSFSQEVIHTREPKAGSDWMSGPSPAVDPDTGALYVVWDEQTEEDGTPYVAFMRSTDQGETWSEPVQVNDEEPKRTWNFSEFFPSVAVAPNGRIDVAYLDWRNDLAYDEEADTNALQDVYYTHSTDGGRTWAPGLRVTDRSIDRRIGVWNTNGLRGPTGIASTDQVAYLTWDDSRNGNEENQTQDVYFSRVRFESPDAVFGTSSLGADARPTWLALGAASALVLGGLVLLIGTRVARRAPPEAEATPAPAHTTE